MMRFHHFSIGLLFSFIACGVHAQDAAYVKRIIDTLCAPHYHGRGYVENGDQKAAAFIVRELQRIGTDKAPAVYDFELGVNTFPGAMELTINGKTLEPGVDYMIDPKSKESKGEFEVVRFKSRWAKTKEKLFDQIASGRFEGRYVVFEVNEEDANVQGLIGEIHKNPLKAAGYIVLTDKKLTWTVSRNMTDCAIFYVQESAVDKKVKSVSVDVDQTFQSEYTGKNVMALIPGTKKGRERTMIFTAHLDHLGRMGADTYIAGANDNASGSAMLLDLYRYYRDSIPEQNVAFIWFGGEEAGLVGSRSFVADSPLNLDSIQFLMNLDLMGDAKTGITVVNGKVFSDQFAILSSLNMELGLLENVKSRGPAANSDHHPFYEKGVPSFFIYTTGDYTHYHDVDDKPENLPLTNYDKVFKLIVEFMKVGI